MKMTAFIPPHPTMYRESPAALKILKKLWKHYHADESEEMARAFIEAENILRECGQIEENSACSRPRTNQHAGWCKGVTRARARVCAVIGTLTS